MHTKILVAYATRMESTSEVAEVIGMILHEQDVNADVLSIDEVEEVASYDAVIIGSAIRGEAWLPEAVKFIEQHRHALSKVPVAYFTVCMTMREDTPENRRKAEAYHKPVLTAVPEVQPIDVGLFGGMLETTEFPRLMRWVISTLNLPSGDYRNWDAIRRWTEAVYPRLLESSVKS